MNSNNNLLFAIIDSFSLNYLRENTFIMDDIDINYVHYITGYMTVEDFENQGESLLKEPYQSFLYFETLLYYPIANNQINFFKSVLNSSLYVQYINNDIMQINILTEPKNEKLIKDQLIASCSIVHQFFLSNYCDPTQDIDEKINDIFHLFSYKVNEKTQIFINGKYTPFKIPRPDNDLERTGYDKDPWALAYNLAKDHSEKQTLNYKYYKELSTKIINDKNCCPVLNNYPNEYAQSDIVVSKHKFSLELILKNHKSVLEQNYKRGVFTEKYFKELSHFFNYERTHEFNDKKSILKKVYNYITSWFSWSNTKNQQVPEINQPVLQINQPDNNIASQVSTASMECSTSQETQPQQTVKKSIFRTCYEYITSWFSFDKSTNSQNNIQFDKKENDKFTEETKAKINKLYDSYNPQKIKDRYNPQKIKERQETINKIIERNV